MAQSKEAMQNTIKNLQSRTDHIYKLEDKGSKVVVLQLGSHSIKMGFANEKAPFTISPYVAYKKSNQNGKAETKLSSEEGFEYEWFKEEYHRIEDMLKSEGVISNDNKPFKGKPRAKQIVNMDRIPTLTPAPALYGDDALRVEKNPNYIFRKLIKYGVLNVEKESDLTICISDFENLISHLMKNKIKIPEAEWSSFNCILIVPDVFIRRHIKCLLQSLFSQIGFKKIYVHLESIMACFGTAVSSACVVDIGHQKINVCCVDEGVILPKTLIRKNFGGKHVSKILAKIFNDKINESTLKGGLMTNCEGDLFQIDKIKEIACAIKEPEEKINRIYEINPIRNNTEVNLQISYSDSICIAANSFFSEIWNSFEAPDVKDPFDCTSKAYDLYRDEEDFFEEFSGGGHVFDSKAEIQESLSNSIYDSFVYTSVQMVILASLLSIKDVESRKKFSSSILFIGGSIQMQRLIEEIMIRLNAKLEALFGVEERAQIATDLPLREISPMLASWLGGTVIPKLDSLRDLWIEKNKFLGAIALDMDDEEEENILDKRLFTRKQQSQEWGIRYLKEKVPFLW